MSNRKSTILAEFKEFGWGSPDEVDTVFLNHSAYRPKSYVLAVPRNSLMPYDIRQALAEWKHVNVNLLIAAVVSEYGWTREAWVRISQLMLANNHAEEYVAAHGHEPMNWVEWELSAYSVDDHRELWKKDF